MADYKQFEHTTGIGIRIKAPTPAKVMVKAAEAMFDIMAEAKVEIKDFQKIKFLISLDAKSVELLLRNWLNELVSLSDVKAMVFTDFQIVQLTANHLHASAWGVAKEKFNIKRDIKTVTSPQININQTGDEFETEIIFDV